ARLLERPAEGCGARAEATAHAAAARVPGPEREPRHELERCLDRRHRAESFLVTVAVQQHAPGEWLERAKIETAFLRFARQKLLEQQCARAQTARIVAFDERRDLVAKAEDAT